MNHNRIFLYVITAFIAISANFTNIQAQTIAAEIPATYDVSETGAFQYNLPIRIPPGIRDMVPNLAIMYNSQSGDGTLGVGWSISGLSAITRGVSTIFHDKKIEPVDFNYDDAFLLDGQRLFYDNATASYLTEVKNFAKIKSYGAAGNGPDYFIVEHPNGLTYEYGNTFSSKMLAQGKTDVLIWALNSVYDKNGNYIDFVYDNSQSTGEYKILSINYGNNRTNPTTNLFIIEFEYATRQDKNKSWVAGSEIQSNSLLENIYIKHKINVGGVLTLNQYHFTYNVNFYSHLTQIDETRNQSTSLPPIIINWGQQAPANPSIGTTITSGSAASYTWSSGDYNGDGFSDFVQLPKNPIVPIFNIYLNDKNNDFILQTTGLLPFTSGTVYNLLNNKPTVNSRYSFDYNGDGLDDLVVINKEILSPSQAAYSVILYLANGSTSVFNTGQLLHWYLFVGGNQSYLDALEIIPGDYDGDGKTELIVLEPLNNFGASWNYSVRLIGDEYGTPNPPIIDFWSFAEVNDLVALDYDGDGKDDIMTVFNIGSPTPAQMELVAKLDVIFDPITSKPTLPSGFALTPISSKAPSSLFNGGNKYPEMLFPGDFNGDGKSDILYWDAIWYIGYSKGEGTGYDIAAIPVSLSGLGDPMCANNFHSYQYGYATYNCTGSASFYISDFNGDGKSDILMIYGSGSTNSSEYKIYYSKGNNEFTSEYYPHTSLNGWQPNQISSNLENNLIGDFNGDGQADLMSLGGPNPLRIVSFYPNDERNLVTSIEHAGKTIGIDYTLIPQDPDFNNITVVGYPYSSKALPIKVTKTLSDNATLNNTYQYGGIIWNNHGLGWRGFVNFDVISITGKKTYNTYIQNTHLPYLAERKIFDALDVSQPFGTKTTYHQYSINGGANGLSRIIVPNVSVTEDYINGEVVESTITTGNIVAGSVFYEYGTPASVDIVRKDMAGNTTGHETTSFVYDLGANFINKGKPISVSKFSEIGNGGNSITRIMDFTYDAITGLILTKKTDPNTLNQVTVTYNYDPSWGNLIKKTINATGIATPITHDYHYTYDQRFIDEETDAEGYTTLYDYGSPTINAWGRLLEKTDPDGRETFYEYDHINRIWKVTDYKGVETTTTYDWASNSSHSTSNSDEQFAIKTETTNISGSNTVIYDLYGRKIRETSPMFDGSDDVYTDYEYTHDGLMQTVTGPYPSSNISLGDMTSYLYDPFNRVVNVNSNTGATSTVYIYNSGVLHTSVTPPNNMMKTYLKWGDKPYHIFNNTENIEYSYYGNGTPKSINANGQVTTFTADAYGRMTKKVEPNAGTTEYFYDALGRVVREKLPNLVEYEYTFDKLGRVIDKKEVNQPNSYTYVYEPANSTAKAGRLTIATAPNGSSVTYDYDTDGELIEMEESDGTNIFTTNYTYDAFGRKATHTYPAGDEITYSYNAYGFLNKVSLTKSPSGLTAQDLWTINSRNHLGQLTNAQYGVNSTTGLYQAVRTFDMYGYPTARKVDNNLSTTTISDMRYNFNQTTGNLSQRKDNLRNLEENFTYDNDYERLIRVQYNMNIWVPPLPDLVMEYDNLGNILKKNDVTNSAYNWKYDTYALTLVPEPNTTIGAPFQPFEIPQNNTQDIEYYPFQKVMKVTEAMKNEVFFTYGPDNERIKAEYTDITIPATPVLLKTKYYANNYEKIVDALSSDETHISYIWGDSEPVAILYQTIGSSPSSAIYYTVIDCLGSITHLLDNQGVTNSGITEERSFDAWGRIRKAATWEPEYFNNPMDWKIDRGYTGHEHIWSSLSSGTVSHNNNIINMNGRLYDALVGRMFSPDPVVTDNTNSQDYNKYTYARNNPLRYTDPSGNTIVQTGQITHVKQPSNQHWTYYAGLALMMATGTSSVYGIGHYAAKFVGSAFTAKTGFLYYAAVGGTNMAVTGFANSTGAAWHNGADFNNGIGIGLKGALISGGTAALTSGISGGFDALSKHTNFFTGVGEFDATDGIGAHGDIYSLLFKAKYKGKFHGVNVYEAMAGDFADGAAVTLPGKGIFLGGKGSYLASLRYNSYEYWVIRHEFGHILQERYHGPFAYRIIAQESLASAIFDRKELFGYKHSHQNFWTETYANHLAYNYFQSPSNWPNYFPIENISTYNAFRLAIAGKF